ncbi:MAG TPA: RNA 2',3'-cyclic phosphodiesterase [Vicinamibacterales bacterium]|nr:RNA 2',3'-cyclic phosphodiesterase [Vicinamibacterales bacterium]
MRLFVAIELDEAVRTAAARLVARLERRVAILAPKARIGWVPPERMHLTVRFIGWVDDAQAARIRRALEPPLRVPVFSMHVGTLGAFPPRGAPRVLWVGVRDESGALADVERDVTARLQALGIPPEDRPYTPHLTLARVRETAGLKSAPLFERLGTTALGVSRVSAVTLFESRLSPKGPTYVPLQRTPLAPA